MRRNGIRQFGIVLAAFFVLVNAQCFALCTVAECSDAVSAPAPSCHHDQQPEPSPDDKSCSHYVYLNAPGTVAPASAAAFLPSMDAVLAADTGSAAEPGTLVAARFGAPPPVPSGPLRISVLRI